MSVKDSIATVLNRNAFYRDGYRMMLKISLIQAGVIGLLILAIVGLVLSIKPHTVYFATTSDGRIIPVVPLEEKYLTPAQLTAWAAKTAQQTMTFGYHDYHDRLQQAATNFTTVGWNSFNKAIDDANFIKAITNHKQVVTMEIGAAPEIDSEGVHNGIYYWIVHMPITIHFDGEVPSEPINVILKLQIVRVSTLQNPDGVSIEQWIQIDPNQKSRP